jgi:metal-dependent HD superfamily phosphatase/phosphodiesterase
MVSDHGMTERDAEVVIAAAALLHDAGMQAHRTDHEAFSLFLAADKLPALLEEVYDEPERSIVVAEALHAIIGHRRRGDPFTVEASILRVADALDMAAGRSRVPFEAGHQNIHSLSAYAIDEVKIAAGREKAVRVEILMSNSAGIFQVDELLATKLRGSGLEEHVEVVARIDAEHEKRLIRVFEI